MSLNTTIAVPQLNKLIRNLSDVSKVSSTWCPLSSNRKRWLHNKSCVQQQYKNATAKICMLHVTVSYSTHPKKGSIEETTLTEHKITKIVHLSFVLTLLCIWFSRNISPYQYYCQNFAPQYKIFLMPYVLST